jgi:choline dehydrogenase-like flavoprotein
MTATEFDYVVVGGGTAGAVVASRLSEDANLNVALVEWGATDEHEPRALQLRRWAEMMGSEFDLDYTSVDQPRGNSRIRQARARILGGCTSHNTMIAFRPPVRDLDEWVAAGAEGWGADEFFPYYDRLATNIVPVAPEHRNPYLTDVISAASTALDIPVRERWNDGPFADGAGFLELGYYPETGRRSSSSVDYLHPIAANRANLHMELETRVLQVVIGPDGDSRPRARAIVVEHADGGRSEITARREIVLCAGSIDTPRLLMLSGVGAGR